MTGEFVTIHYAIKEFVSFTCEMTARAALVSLLHDGFNILWPDSHDISVLEKHLKKELDSFG